MLKCAEVIEKTSDYIDKSLPPIERLKIKMHLIICLKCRQFVQQIRFTIKSVKQLGSKQSVSELSETEIDKIIKKSSTDI